MNYAEFKQKRQEDIKNFPLYFAFSDQLKENLKNYDFAVSAFRYELANHEYTYTWDVTPAFEALSLTKEDVSNDMVLAGALNQAIDLIQDEFYNEPENITGEPV